MLGHMASDKKVLEELATENPNVDLHLWAEFLRLTKDLPDAGQGAAYSLGDQVPDRQPETQDQLLNRAFARFWSRNRR